MKIFSYILIAIAIGLIIFNLTKIDYSAPFEGDSSVAVISVLAAACAILLILILRTSQRIAKKKK
ncbi:MULTISPECIES: hypothetical protein [Altibacter]|uniref:hypothetical protein n=1 Tax=Altibacter TaxID=1535231 RepID=UPI0005548D24|nr:MULTISPECIES: hypothetical protein [Altibacter]MAP55850.1 hypothetical protein [Altibacter sp.]MCW8981709.1 hypothetical protein [Altibacter sp.]MCW9038305.1 hypothetical protein [Altibacter sp.]|tara:strand:- start:497 stop:691 length:195 start_codon:yes stop_codon:yes gene_type:complete